MSNVILFQPRANNAPAAVMTATAAKLQEEDFLPTPQTAAEYLAVCKDMLADDDYREVLCGIMDAEIYKAIDKENRQIVNHYFEYLKS